MPTIAFPSTLSLYLEGVFGGASLSSGTGFIVERDGVQYVVTNWHNVTGRHPETKNPLHPTGGVPDGLRIFFNVHGSLGAWVQKIEPLYDSHGAPLWLEHPVHMAGAIDVVALPITDLLDVAILAYDLWGATPAIAIGPSDTLSIIGFPFGITGGGYFGIWVQGTIASEPGLELNGLPLFLIDSRTRPGQSGSPVIAYRTGMVSLEDGSSAMFGGPVYRLVGIYSGRINEQSDLGRVWKRQAIIEIIKNGQRGLAP